MDDKIHIRLFETEENLEEELRFFINDAKTLLGFVSLDAPLISNLNVINNITLIPQYHRNMPLKQAEALTYDLLQRFGMASIANRKITNL